MAFKYIMNMTRFSTACILLVAVILPSCRTAKMSVADEQMARGEYFDASKTYRKIYNKLTKREERAQRGEVAFKLGQCYTRLNQAARASAAFQNAIRYNYPDSTATLLLAQALHADGKYVPAVKAYEEYLEVAPQSKIAQTGLAGARTAAGLRKDKTRYVVKQPKFINSRRADFSPMFNGET